MDWKRINEFVEALEAEDSPAAVEHAALREADAIIPGGAGVCLFGIDGRCLRALGTSESVVAAYNGHFRRVMDFMPIPWDRVVYTGTRTLEVFELGAFPNSEFYRDFALPNGIERTLAHYFPGQPRSLFIARGRFERGFSDEERSTLRTLNRHFNCFYRILERIADKPTPRYSHPSLPRDRADELSMRLRRLMAERKPFLDPELSLPELAAMSGMTRNALSQLLNEVMGLSFSDFVNGFRIEEARRLLSDPGSSLSILDIAFEAGFNSKSAFYRSFGRLESESPRARYSRPKR
jgi:AraC-like DNA-binding protein